MILNDNLSEIINDKNNYYKIYNEQIVINNNLSRQINNIKQEFDEYKNESLRKNKSKNKKMIY
jgi:hypothetical protein